MVKFNEGRFIIMFSIDAGNVTAIYDTREEKYYDVKHPAFSNVFDTYVQMLPREAAEELASRLNESILRARVNAFLQKSE